ncbi:MAG: NAD(P)H-binding protein [Hyphomicrobiales bacterium]|nr:NAD(P)H-binding protein [Hyphomicrobiales bacterium]
MTQTLKFEKVAVLGATGPTGRALAAELTGRGIATRVMSRSAKGLEAAFPGAGIERRTGDALDPAALAAAIDGCDLVVDCIGFPADRMADHPRTARNLAAAIGRTGAKCLQVSSYWCYMPIVETPLSEAHARSGGPLWARLRRETEDILRAAGAAVIHLPDFFGPHVEVSLLQTAIKDAVAGKPMNWVGAADVKRDHIYVPDAMRIAADLIVHEEAYGEDWIIPGSGPISAKEIAAILKGLLKRDVRVRAAGPFMLRLVSPFKKELRDFMPMVPEYVKPISFDGAKIERLLGPLRHTAYEAALAATVASLRAD